MDNINKECVCGDLDPKVLDNMHNVLGNVFLPVLSNPKNQHVRPRPAPPHLRTPGSPQARFWLAAGCEELAAAAAPVALAFRR